MVPNVTDGKAGRSVKFSGMIGEVMLPDVKGKALVEQLARTPLVCGFKAGCSSKCARCTCTTASRRHSTLAGYVRSRLWRSC